MTEPPRDVPRGAIWLAFLILWPIIVVGYNWWLMIVGQKDPHRGVDMLLGFAIGNALLVVSFAVSAVILLLLLGLIERRLRRKAAAARVTASEG